MNTVLLNMVHLDGAPIIKKGSGGGSTGGGGSTAPGTKWTGHADAEGLKAIGWTDEDIAYYQEHGVNWNAEDDEYHKVTDDNKALYGVLTVYNIQTYKDRIVYLPKIDTSNVKDMSYKFYACDGLKAIPMIDTSKVTDMGNMFTYCYTLTCIPPLDTSNVLYMSNMFNTCYSLAFVPPLDTKNVQSMTNMFYQCYSLSSIYFSDTSKVTNMSGIISKCPKITSLPPFNAKDVSFYVSNFEYCYSLINIKLKNLSSNLILKNSKFLSKESLLYLINNEAATSAITITLESNAYERLANDADIVAALANHPNISIAQ